MSKRTVLCLVSMYCMCIVSRASAQDSVLAEGEWGIQVNCAEAVTASKNYRATAHGTLRATGEYGLNSTLIIAGSVEVHLTPNHRPARTVRVDVKGELYRDASSAYGHVVAPSTPDDVEAVYINLPGGDYSAVLAYDPKPGTTIKTSYDMNCEASRVKLPPVADLVVSSELWDTYGIAISSRAYLTVKNIGDAPVLAKNIQIRIGGFSGRGESVLDANTAEFNVIRPGDVGTIALPLPAGSLSSCTLYDVAVDIDGLAQTHYYDELSNDTGSLSTPCLDWTTPIDVFTFVDKQTGDLSIVEDKTLEQIVSNQVSGRADGKLCIECHTRANGRRYLPPTGLISPTQIIEGKSWAQPGGWAEQLQAVPSKPGHLKRLMHQWKHDGAH